MGCCESNKSIEDEVQISDKPFRSSDFYDINLDSPNELKGFDFDNIQTNKSTCNTSRIDSAFLQSLLLNT